MALVTQHWTDDVDVRDDADLRALLRDVADLAHEPVPPDQRAHDLDLILAATAPARATSPWRRRIRRALALTGVKIVLAGGVATAATTGLAATGTLPAPAQQFVHDIGARVGIGLPAAPGQLAKATDDPDDTGRDHAPGRVAESDPDVTPRDLAPGQVGRQDHAPPGLDPDRTSSGQDTERMPPGQDTERTPPSQDRERTPPGQPEVGPAEDGPAPEVPDNPAAPGRDRGNADDTRGGGR